MPTTLKNQAVIDFLIRYCTFPHPPGYAALISGKWGVGKTHLIKRVLQSPARLPDGSERQLPSLYVSLYGKTELAQIDDELFVQLHPVLGSKGMKLAVAALRGTIKTTVKIDIPDFDLAEKLQNAADYILVFDDLERCSIPATEVLGYINSFIEHNDCKVIIIANESEMRSKEASYDRIKEKIVGATFEVFPEFDEALNEFLSLIDDKWARDIIKENGSSLKTLFDESEAGNLRILQQSLWDFERIGKALSEKHRNNSRAMEEFLLLYVALSIELKLGRVTEKDIREFLNRFYARLLKEDAESPQEKIIRRYSGINFDNPLINHALLAQAIGSGLLDEASIQKSADANRHFQVSNEEPTWLALWQNRSYDDKIVEAARIRVEKQFEDRSIDSLGSFLQIVGLRLWMGKIGAIPYSNVDVMNQSIQYIDDLYKAKKLDTTDISSIWMGGQAAWGGYGIYESDSMEFKKIMKHLSRIQNIALEDSYPEKAAALLKEMRNSPDVYSRRLTPNGGPDSTYSRVPILRFCDPGEFVNVLLSLCRTDQENVFTTLKARYESAYQDSPIREEIPWLEAVVEILRAAAETMSPIAKHILQKNIEWNITPILGSSEKS